MSEKLEQNQPASPFTNGKAANGEPLTPTPENNLEAGLPEAPVSNQAYLKAAADAGGDTNLEYATVPASTSLLAETEPATAVEAISAPEDAAPPLVPTEPQAPAVSRHVKSFWREVLETVLLTVMIFFLVKGLVANFRILGTSMEPNFHTDQLVLVNKAAYFHVDINSWLKLIPGVHPEGNSITWLFGGPKRGDVVIFEPPDVVNEDYIKRVIGLPGDKVEVKNGKVYINDIALDEPYIREAPFSPFPAAVVPSGHLFVMGDNRNASRDSRSFGMLSIDLVVGKALMVYWPSGPQWGLVPEVKYGS